MGQLDKLESVLDENLNKKAPVKLPPDARKAIANNLWWIALILGVLQLWAVWDLWNISRVVGDFVDYANAISRAYGGETVDDLGPLYYLSVIVLAIDAALLLLASPALKEMRKRGWTLLFYCLLLNVAYGVVRMFAGHNGGFDDFLWAAVTSLIGAYLLFQVRDHFTGAAVHHVEHKTEPKVEGEHKSATNHEHKADDKK